MKSLLFTACIWLFSNFCVFGQSTRSAGWKSLFNEKDFTGWETYLDRPYAKDEQPKVAPLGLNNDPNHVFSVVQEDGKPALRVSGETFGGINTLADFENYHLRLEFKWGTKKWPPKLDRPRDSGLLYHSVGPHGTAMLWMESFEFQIQEGDCGDYWGVMDVLPIFAPAKMTKANSPISQTVTWLRFRIKQTMAAHVSKIQTPKNRRASGMSSIYTAWAIPVCTS